MAKRRFSGFRLGEFTVKVKSSKYKTIEGYLRRVYRDNKELIDASLPDSIKDKRKSFVESVKDELKYGNKMKRVGDRVKYSPHKTVTSALRQVGRSEVYLPPAERFKQNAMKGLKSSGNYRVFRELTRDKKTGRYTAFDPSKMKYQGKGTYSYGDVTIKYENSPKKVKVYRS